MVPLDSSSILSQFKRQRLNLLRNLLGLVRSENILNHSAVLFAKAVLLRSPPPHCGCFAHNGRSALYSFVCSVSGVRALRFRIIRTCAPLNFRNIFRVAFLLSCHIFDCIGISDACLAGCPCCLFSAATQISYIRPFRLSSTFLSFS